MQNIKISPCNLTPNKIYFGQFQVQSVLQFLCLVKELKFISQSTVHIKRSPLCENKAFGCFCSYAVRSTRKDRLKTPPAASTLLSWWHHSMYALNAIALFNIHSSSSLYPPWIVFVWICIRLVLTTYKLYSIPLT
jgi:hypothetical protein